MKSDSFGRLLESMITTYCRQWSSSYEFVLGQTLTDNSFFGEEPSNFALSCYNVYMEKKNLKKMLDLGCGQGRDTLFFASKGIEIMALDYSSVAIKGLINHHYSWLLLYRLLVYKYAREQTDSCDILKVKKESGHD